MAEFKLTIADPKTGKCVQKAVKGDAANGFIGKSIGDKVEGEVIDATGYEFLITGGSDNCGFPMRKGITGARKRILTKPGVGFRGKRKGIRKRKTVCGETINDSVVQINLKTTKKGKGSLTAEASEEGKEEKEEDKKEGNKEEAKKESKEEKKEDKSKKDSSEKKEE